MELESTSYSALKYLFLFNCDYIRDFYFYFIMQIFGQKDIIFYVKLNIIYLDRYFNNFYKWAN